MKDVHSGGRNRNVADLKTNFGACNDGCGFSAWAGGSGIASTANVRVRDVV